MDWMIQQIELNPNKRDKMNIRPDKTKQFTFKYSYRPSNGLELKLSCTFVKIHSFFPRDLAENCNNITNNKIYI